MKLESSINNLFKRIERFDPSAVDDIRYWKGKEVIPLEEWKKLKGTPYELRYFPDDYDSNLTFKPESELKDERVKKWNIDYLELMGHRKNPNYGETFCFDCPLNTHWDESAIFIGINKLVVKSLEDNNTPLYPCKIINRFECPYEKGKIVNAKFDVDDLFKIEETAFAVEIAFAVAQKNTSKIQIKNKQELYHALTDRETLYKIIEQALDYVSSPERNEDAYNSYDINYNNNPNVYQIQEAFNRQNQRHRKEYQENKDKIVDHLMSIKNKVKLEELRFY